ncbi:MAG: protoporphyrinogen oxidase [Alphaproteobacteria bacterium]|nr:protoporphyrinogen oxidase [Alphaproteobacteria bacterium]
MTDNAADGGATVIIGGGISGLAVAWFLHHRGLAVRVLERDHRVGGLIGTDLHDGWLVERGPNSTLWKQGREEDAFGRLMEQTGLAIHRVEASRAGAKRFVMRGRRLLALPGGPAGFIATGLFSTRAKLRLLAEPWVGRAALEETIAAFVIRRLGREFLDYAVEPFVSGVYAGDPAQLSVQAAVPRIYALEQQHGSLIRGAIAMGKAAKSAGMPAGRLVSFDRGMAALPEGIVAALPPGTVRTGVEVTGLVRERDGWRVSWNGGGEWAARVVLAVPAGKAQSLLAPIAPEAARILGTIAYAPIVSAAFGWPRGRIGHALDGFGFLVPRREGLRLLGGLFSSSLFPERAPPDHALIPAFLGGATDPGAVALDDDGGVGAELTRILSVSGKPEMTQITRWPQAIPQYTLGHLSRVTEIDRLTAALPGLYLRGSWRDGVSVADCVRNGETVAHGIAKRGIAKRDK